MTWTKSEMKPKIEKLHTTRKNGFTDTKVSDTKPKVSEILCKCPFFRFFHKISKITDTMVSAILVSVISNTIVSVKK